MEIIFIHTVNEEVLVKVEKYKTNDGQNTVKRIVGFRGYCMRQHRRGRRARDKIHGKRARGRQRDKGRAPISTVFLCCAILKRSYVGDFIHMQRLSI